MSVDVTSLPLEVWGGQGSYLHGDSDDIISCLPLLITPSSIGVTKVTCRCTRAHTQSHTQSHTRARPRVPLGTRLGGPLPRGEFRKQNQLGARAEIGLADVAWKG